MSDLFAPGAMEALRGVLSGVDPKTGKPLEESAKAANATALGAIGGYVFAGESIKRAAPGIIEGTIKALSDMLTEPAYNLAKTFLGNMVDQGIMTTSARDQIIGTLDGMKAISPVVVVAMAVSMVVGYVKSVLTGSMSLAEQNVYRGIRPSLPGIGDIIRAVYIDPTTTEKWREVARRSGIPEEYIQMILKSSYSPLDVQTIRDLYLRRGGDEALAVKRLKELAYTDERIKELMETWAVIPGPQDIIRMAVREAFSPDQVISLGLDDAFPAELAEWAGKVGLKDPWPKMYWRSHWELPSASMGFEMLHRGIITERELAALLKALDYAPVWHERLKAIAYNVVTRVDARRLYELGVWDEAKLTEAYRKMGYAPEDAEDLTAWTKVEYAQGDKEVTRAQIEKAYSSHIVDRREALSMLVELGYSDERSEWILDIADFTAATAVRSETIASVKDMYLAGLADKSEVREKLGEQEVDPAYIEALIGRWEVEIWTRRKLPSKSDLDKFLKAGVIAESEYKRELKRLGYSTEIADMYYELNTKG